VKRFLDALPERFKWTLHNLVAHPLGEVLFQLGFESASDAIHEVTIPTHERGTGRG
jgi:ethanolamine utilization microcompartment shell protein EutS